MKTSKRQLRRIIREAIKDSMLEEADDRQSHISSALANIEKQFGAGAVMRQTPQSISKEWMAIARRNPQYTEKLLHVWDHLLDGDEPRSVADVYGNDFASIDSGGHDPYEASKSQRLTTAILAVGKKMERTSSGEIANKEQYLTSAQMKQQIGLDRDQATVARMKNPPMRRSYRKYSRSM